MLGPSARFDAIRDVGYVVPRYTSYLCAHGPPYHLSVTEVLLVVSRFEEPLLITRSAPGIALKLCGRAVCRPHSVSPPAIRVVALSGSRNQHVERGIR